jgi:hypothetical protein
MAVFNETIEIPGLLIDGFLWYTGTMAILSISMRPIAERRVLAGTRRSFCNLAICDVTIEVFSKPNQRLRFNEYTRINQEKQ